MRNWWRSLRVRLQLWHAVILMMVVLGFGTVLYNEIVRSRWDEVDGQLLATGRILEGGLRKVPRLILDSMAQDIGAPRRNQAPRRRRDGSPLDDRSGMPGPPNGPNGPAGPNGLQGPLGGPPGGPLDRRDGPPAPPGGGQPPGLIPPGSGVIQWGEPLFPNEMVAMEEWERNIQLPFALPNDPRLNEGPPYYVIWRRDGSILRQQHVPYDATARPLPLNFDTLRRSTGTPEAGPLREIFIRGPEETLICVGRSVRGEVRRMWNLAWQLSLAGVCIMASGLCGGWWLSRRAIAPIKHMTETAASISPTNLSQRIDLGGVDLELAELGTMLNTMLERLEGAFETQRRFTSDASHELRTPLAVLLSTIELTLSRTREPAEYQSQLQKCQRAAVRMQHLVQSLLTLARSDESAPSDRTQTFDLSELVRECAGELEALARERHVTLASELASVIVKGNKYELSQVVTNLITNAILYNKPQGEVLISLTADGDDPRQVKLAIRDTGIGIPEKDLPELFKRFYRVDTARSRSLGGNGLGLAICQNIVTLHGGTITATSQVDVGSEFVVTLPGDPSV